MSGIAFNPASFVPVPANASSKELSKVIPLLSEAEKTLQSQQKALDQNLSLRVLAFTRSIVNAQNTTRKLQDRAYKLHARALYSLNDDSLKSSNVSEMERNKRKALNLGVLQDNKIHLTVDLSCTEGLETTKIEDVIDLFNEYPSLDQLQFGNQFLSKSIIQVIAQKFPNIALKDLCSYIEITYSDSYTDLSSRTEEDVIQIDSEKISKPLLLLHSKMLQNLKFKNREIPVSSTLKTQPTETITFDTEDDDYIMGFCSKFSPEELRFCLSQLDQNPITLTNFPNDQQIQDAICSNTAESREIIETIEHHLLTLAKFALYFDIPELAAAVDRRMGIYLNILSTDPNRFQDAVNFYKRSFQFNNILPEQHIIGGGLILSKLLTDPTFDLSSYGIIPQMIGKFNKKKLERIFPGGTEESIDHFGSQITDDIIDKMQTRFNNLSIEQQWKIIKYIQQNFLAIPIPNIKDFLDSSFAEDDPNLNHNDPRSWYKVLCSIFVMKISNEELFQILGSLDRRKAIKTVSEVTQDPRWKPFFENSDHVDLLLEFLNSSDKKLNYLIFNKLRTAVSNLCIGLRGNEFEKDFFRFRAIYKYLSEINANKMSDSPLTLREFEFLNFLNIVHIDNQGKRSGILKYYSKMMQSEGISEFDISELPEAPPSREYDVFENSVKNAIKTMYKDGMKLDIDRDTFKQFSLLFAEMAKNNFGITSKFYSEASRMGVLLETSKFLGVYPEEGEEKWGKYFEFDNDLNPLGLTGRGIMLFLLELGYLKN